MNNIDISKVEKIITYNYNEFGNEFGDTLVDLKREYIELQDTLKDREEYCDKLEEYRESILKENKKYKEVLDKIKENTERTIEIIKQQPTEDDTWILERLNGNLKILEKIENE